jgi:hypothetical protein
MPLTLPDIRAHQTTIGPRLGGYLYSIESVDNSQLHANAMPTQHPKTGEKLVPPSDKRRGDSLLLTSPTSPTTGFAKVTRFYLGEANARD